MKKHLLLFITHFDDYLDVCLKLNGDDGFDKIRDLNHDLKSKRNSITIDEYRKIEVDIFYEYLKMINVVD